MKVTKLLLLFAVTAPFVFAAANVDEPTKADRARQLKDYLKKEKPLFEARETQRKDALEELDRLNSNQNHVREHISEINNNQKELNMAIGNLSMEYQKQRELEQQQRRRLFLLLKVVYKIRKDGILRFVMDGHNLSQLAGRVRIVYHTLRSHTLITQQLEERALRLQESEKKLSTTKQELQTVLSDLKEQEELLGSLLHKKKAILKSINQKQNSYQIANRELKRISAQLASMFHNFEQNRDTEQVPFPRRGSLTVPVVGHVTKGFGKTVHEKFGTVTWHKGLEIEADQGSAVVAVLPGVVEYSGWVRGLGNVVILHHGGGFYSLNAHLFKASKPSGSRVEQGELIGLVGDTGNSDRPSLYFEFRENGKAVDPVNYFSRSSIASLQ